MKDRSERMTYVKKTHRFGLLTPSSNTTQEPEFSAALPPTISLHTGRVAYRDITPEEQDRCVLELESESRKLADAEVGVIVFAATAPTLAKGKGYDRELIKRMEDASGRPATTAATAFVDALRLLGAEKVSIGAPWSKTMDKPMVEFMQASGFNVVHSEVVGFAYSSSYRPRPGYRLTRETSVYLAEHARGQGLGRRLYDDLLAAVSADGIHVALALIALPNAPSVALHEACGFEHLGTMREVGRKFDRWLDTAWYQRIL